MNIIKKLLHKYVYQDWNIAIAICNDDLSLKDIKWMQHNYKDRWFADPFIIEDTEDTYIVLVEEYLYSTHRGRIARLTVRKTDCLLLQNETILDFPTHLSFPNPIVVDGEMYVYPENGEAGNTKFYHYGKQLEKSGVLMDLPLADATIQIIDKSYFLFTTIGKECNGNVLSVFKSDSIFGPYDKCQEVQFADNTARRAGNAFEWHGKMISPAQICNHDYGEGICLQQVVEADGKLIFSEIKRMMPPTIKYPEGFHTYNVYGDNIVVIDGYRYGSKLLHNLYFKIRK